MPGQNQVLKKRWGYFWLGFLLLLKAKNNRNYFKRWKARGDKYGSCSSTYIITIRQGIKLSCVLALNHDLCRSDASCRHSWPVWLIQVNPNSSVPKIKSPHNLHFLPHHTVTGFASQNIYLLLYFVDYKYPWRQQKTEWEIKLSVGLGIQKGPQFLLGQRHFCSVF